MGKGGGCTLPTWDLCCRSLRVVSADRSHKVGMGQDTANRKTSELKSQRIATMMALLLCVGLAIVVSWSAGYSLSSCEGTKVTNAPSRAAARVFSSGSYDRLTRDKTAKQLGWEKHAKANLTNYKNNILSLVRPHYGKQGFWSVFLPIISCPPDRPLTRYGGTGDGSKLLCSLPSSLQQPGCVIYSLGSNGEGTPHRIMTINKAHSSLCVADFVAPVTLKCCVPMHPCICQRHVTV